MPILGKLIVTLFGGLFGLVKLLVGAYWATRVTAAVMLGGIYLACVVYYTTMIGPWFGMLFSTAYGALLGLLFPPIAGSVVFGISAYYTCVVGKRYTSKLFKMMMG